jgi:hypothetical protein
LELTAEGPESKPRKGEETEISSHAAQLLKDPCLDVCREWQQVEGSHKSEYSSRVKLEMTFKVSEEQQESSCSRKKVNWTWKHEFKGSTCSQHLVTGTMPKTRINGER